MSDELKLSPWFALSVRPRWENLVAEALSAKGYETFAPTELKRRRWADRQKSIFVPLFPGYVFCRLADSASGLVVTTPGVVGFVGFGGKPASIEDSEIRAVQRIVDSKLDYDGASYLSIGDRVRIHDGPLNGLSGILVGEKNSHRLAVSVSLVQRTILVDVEQRWVRRIGRRESLQRERKLA